MNWNRKMRKRLKIRLLKESQEPKIVRSVKEGYFYFDRVEYKRSDVRISQHRRVDHIHRTGWDRPIGVDCGLFHTVISDRAGNILVNHVDSHREGLVFYE